jgi:hypothetical protein
LTVEQRRRFLVRKRQAVLRKFKAKKKDRGKLFYVDARTGRPVRRQTTRQVYAVYVAKTGRKIPVNPKDVGGLAGIKAHRPTTYNLTRSRYKRAAVALAQSIRAVTVSQGEGTIKPQRGRRQVSHAHLTNRLSRALARAASSIDPKARREFQVELAVTIQHGGKTETEIVRLSEFGAGFNQKLRSSDLKRYASARVYGAISEALGARGLIVKGSAEHVRRLKVNRGKHPSQWKAPVTEFTKGGRKTRKLYLWRHAQTYAGKEYNTGELVAIKQISYRIKREK